MKVIGGVILGLGIGIFGTAVICGLALMMDARESVLEEL